MTQGQAAHAKHYAPSAAYAWLSCPAYAQVCIHYNDDDTAASTKGDEAHGWLEAALLFGILPDTDDPDMDMNVAEMVAWVKNKRKEYGKHCELYAEQRYDIPETGEFGTGDITFVTPDLIHIADYKNGYVPVDVKMNPQLLLYLCGAIAKFGERKRYLLTVLQPNYDHKDGPIRTYEVTQDNLEWFRQQVAWATAPHNRNLFQAGKHCKTSYCEHRGSCEVFQEWAKDNAADAYYPSEIGGMSNEQLSTALDHSDILQGLRDKLRGEAMRRIMQQDARIQGYKVVRGRKNRDFASDHGRAECYKALLDMGYEEKHLVETKTHRLGGLTIVEQSPLTVVGVERMVKQKFKTFGRGKWKKVWDEYMQPHVRDYTAGLTLERAIDGRDEHRQGSEFDVIPPEQPATDPFGLAGSNVHII